MKKSQSGEWTNYNLLDVDAGWSQCPKQEVVDIVDDAIFDDDDSSGDDSDIPAKTFMEYMDIREPIMTLRDMLSQRIGFPLDQYEFWLQDTNLLEPHKNLVDQCVQGEGLVQINSHVNVKLQKINIVDILKPPEDVLQANTKKTSQESSSGTKRNYEGVSTNSPKSANKNWAIDNQFKRDQARLKIPDNPVEWTHDHVKFWLDWAMRQFSQARIRSEDWNITGEELNRITLEEFKEKVPTDPGDYFYTHLELLRKCKYVAVLQKNGPPTFQGGSGQKKVVRQLPVIADQKDQQDANKSSKGKERWRANNGDHSTVNRSGNNGQIQLWQFLLDILTDVDHRNVIQWEGYDGQFKLTDPERVAQLWGIRKNKPNMNYEKLSRALRYYYDGDMLAKVHGKRFVYKFVCNLQQLLGYDARELALLVMEQS